MKLKLFSALLIVVSLSSSLGLATGTSTNTTGPADSVNGAYQDSKSQNTWGMVANVAGGGLHAVSAYGFWGQCGSNNYAACAMAIAETMAAASSIGQAGKHGSSNQGIIPNLCATAAGICNPNQFQWPDFNSCAGNVSCYNNVISNSGNPDLQNLFNGGGVDTGTNTTTSTAPTDYSKLDNVIKNAGGTFDPKTGAVTFNGKTFNPQDFQKPTDVAKIPGMTEAEIAKINANNAKIEKAVAALKDNPKVQAAVNSEAVNAAIAAANGGGVNGADGKAGSGAGSGGSAALAADAAAAGVGVDGLGTGGIGNMFGDGIDPSGMGRGKNGGAKGLKGGRVPAGVAGKKRNFNGEPIGVAGDSIFEMMSRRYQVKTQQNTFLDLVVVAPK